MSDTHHLQHPMVRVLPPADEALDREGVAYETIDIERDPSAAEYVMQVNGGNQTVPTVVFPDGSAATNPSVKDVLVRMGASA